MACINHGVILVASVFYLPQPSPSVYQRRSCEFDDVVGNGDRAILGLARHWRASNSNHDWRDRGGISSAWFSHYPHTMVRRHPVNNRLEIFRNKERKIPARCDSPTPQVAMFLCSLAPPLQNQQARPADWPRDPSSSAVV